jgi:hypothetical protein
MRAKHIAVFSLIMISILLTGVAHAIAKAIAHLLAYRGGSWRYAMPQLLLCILIVCVCLACFSPWQGTNGEGTIAINVGGGNALRSRRDYNL